MRLGYLVGCPCVLNDSWLGVDRHYSINDYVSRVSDSCRKSNRKPLEGSTFVDIACKDLQIYCFAKADVFRSFPWTRSRDLGLPRLLATKTDSWAAKD